MIRTDAIFRMGCTHQICQDYAWASENEIRVSDGCSSSPDTDFGARSLCRGIPMFGLPEGWNDATLLRAYEEEGVIYATVRGDGCVLGRRRDGTWIAYVVEYPSGAPFYPSYEDKVERMVRYVEQFGEEKIIRVYESGKEDSFPAAGLETTSFFLDTSEFDCVVLATDGLLSFQKEGKTLPLSQIVPQIFPKDFRGEFLKRRIIRFLKEMKKEGWDHTDDVGFAALGVE